MEFKKLGNSDILVSSYCLGTMTFGETTSEDDAHSQINHSIENGINFIDTAEMYPTCPIRSETTGRTEEIIGSWNLINKNKRKDIILATKIVGNGFKNIREGGPINKKTIELAIHNSLKRLKTDYIDLYQLHWPNRGSYHFRTYWDYKPKSCDMIKTENEFFEILETLYSFKQKGIIREVGLSNETCWGTMKYLEIMKNFKDFSIVSVQNEYSLMCRLFDLDFNELAINENIKLLAYSPLARGLLTGKYLNNSIPKDSRLSRDDKIKIIKNDKSDEAVKAYINCAKKYEIDPIHMSLAFCNERPFMGSVIFGATSIEQLKRIVKGIYMKLSEEIYSDLQKIYKRYPMTF